MENFEFALAEQFALYTNKHFFLTGKAGTGKTTLLKKIAKQTTKNFVVAHMAELYNVQAHMSFCFLFVSKTSSQ